MQRNRWTIAALCLLAGSALAQTDLAEFVVWPVADGGNGHRYALTVTPASWTATEAFAESRGGHLASITSAEESAFLRETYLTGTGAGRDLWIGLTCPTPLDYLDRDNWVWTDGSPVTFTNWRGAQPDLGGGDDRYIAVNFHRDGSIVWDNYPDSSFRIVQGIVEWPSCAVADLAGPFGVLDLSDINAFIDGFVGDRSIADLDGNGIFDLADVNLFVQSFVAGCL
jgi:hypothetical protein